MFRPRTVEHICEQFWARVDTSGDCWIWTGYRNSKGYGRTCIDSVQILTHRVAWGYAHGMPPDDLDVLHKCDNPPCVRHHHLFLGTHLDNMRDAASKGRIRSPRLNGERHPAAKFTLEQVREIIARRQAGEKVAVLAAEFGVWQSAISKIANGRLWSAALKEQK